MATEEMERNIQEVWELFRETDRRFRETDRKFEETDRKFQATDRRFQDLRDLFTSQWGKLVEALIAPGALKQFQDRGVPVTGTRQRAKQRKNGEVMEIDVLAINDDSVVAVEVKTTLKVDDVKDFLEKLPRFKEFFEEYDDMKLYGAVAGISIDEQADRFAYKNGLYVLTLSGEGTVVILNDEKFVPKEFSP
jgi:hypothetical protein